MKCAVTSRLVGVTYMVEQGSTVRLLTWCRVVSYVEEVVPTLEYVLEPTYSV